MFWCLFGRTVLMSFCLILMDLEIIYNFYAGYRILLSVWYKRNLGGENGVILQGMKSLWTQWALAEVLVFISLLGDEWDVKPVTCLMGDPILLPLTNPLGFILLSVIKLYRWKFVALLWCIWRQMNEKLWDGTQKPSNISVNLALQHLYDWKQIHCKESSSSAQTIHGLHQQLLLWSVVLKQSYSKTPALWCFSLHQALSWEFYCCQNTMLSGRSFTSGSRGNSIAYSGELVSFLHLDI